VLDIALCFNPNMYRGSWKDVRKAGINSAERQSPGLGHLHGGHERRTFEKHYMEWRDKPRVLPEALSGYLNLRDADHLSNTG
jgi:hypothetical protein